MKPHCATDSTRGTIKNPVGQRIISAKSLRLKELQNQLADAHYHLNELASENRLLRSLQKRQDSALKKYEGTNAELPRIINSHHEELKVLQTKYKRLRIQHKQTCDLLKERENEVHSLQSQNRHLLQLSKDRQLGEREKLQMQVSDLNLRVEKQQEKIQILNRKLALETKSLKHQLHTEITKHKSTEKQLSEALEKLTEMEDKMEKREKQYYQNNNRQLPVFNKKSKTTSQSLTSLEIKNLVKSSTKSHELNEQSDFKNQSLPKLTINESNNRVPIEKVPKTETMASLQQVRKFRLQGSPQSRHSSARALLTDNNHQDLQENLSLKIQKHHQNLEDSMPMSERLNSQDLADEEIKNIMADPDDKHSENKRYQLPEELIKEFGCSSSDDDDEDLVKQKEIPIKTSKSRDLHARLVNGSMDSPDQQTHSNNSKILGKIDCKVSKKRDVPSDSESESDVQAIGKEKKEEIVENLSGKMDKSLGELNAPKRSLNFEHESSRERLLNLTKSWTEMQENIKREREVSERELRALERENIENNPGSYDEDDDDDDDLENSDRKLLRYFERDRNDDEGISKDKNSLNNLFVLEQPHSGDSLRVKNNGYSPVDDDEDDNNAAVNGESSSRDDDTPETVIQNPKMKYFSAKNNDKIELKSNKDIKKKNIEKDKELEEARRVNNSDSIGNFDKNKLLAAMNAIDNNENIEFLTTSQKNRSGNLSQSTRSEVTEKLYRGLPTHVVRKKEDVIKDIFGDTGKFESKIRSRCSKLH